MDFDVEVFAQLEPPCIECIRIRDLLLGNGVRFKWHDVSSDVLAQQCAEQLAGDAAKIPIVVFNDWTVIVEATKEQVLEKLIDMGMVSTAGLV